MLLIVALFGRRSVAVLLLLRLGLTAPGAGADEKNKYINEAISQLKVLDGRVEKARAKVRATAGQLAQAEARWLLAGVLHERSRMQYHLGMERHPDKDSLSALDSEPVKRDQTEAVRELETMLKEWPDSPRCPEAMLSLSQILRVMGEYSGMLDSLFRLVERFPDSPLADRALLLLGAYEFDRMMIDRSEKYYRQVLQGPVHDFDAQARYYLGWIAVNRGDCKAALVEFGQVAALRGPVRVADQYLGAIGEQDLRREALVDMTYCYSKVHRSAATFEYFGRFQMSKEEARAVYEKLARRYWVMQDLPGAQAMFRHLLDLGGEAEQVADWKQTLVDVERQLNSRKKE